MTRRTSSRALAQEIYREMAPSLTLPRERGREKAEVGGGEKTDPATQNLTEKARELYETSAVPVAEIARLCGVTERTIYKYARRENWAPRYRWSADGSRPRGASWRAPGRVAPVKGAAGRFVCCAEKGQPFATGLHAADAQAAARAAAACAEAEARARAAEADAERDALLREYEMASKGLHRAMDDLIALRKRRAQRKGARPPADDAMEQALATTLRVYMDWRREAWEELKSHWHKDEQARQLEMNRVTAP